MRLLAPAALASWPRFFVSLIMGLAISGAISIEGEVAVNLFR